MIIYLMIYLLFMYVSTSLYIQLIFSDPEFT